LNTDKLTLHYYRDFIDCKKSIIMAIWSVEIKELAKLYQSFQASFLNLKRIGPAYQGRGSKRPMLYSRRCLEVIITDLCDCELNRPRKTEPLQGIIDKLNKESKVPSHIVASMHSLNSLATFGAHLKILIRSR
jgi:hypothetical protein